MDVDVVGRIRHARLGKTRALNTIYEAIINSIHSIEDRNIENGRIDITIKRSDQSELVEGYKRDIESFEIKDNGIGFNKDNYQSFNTSDSRYKEDRGGQGVGRFLWLKVFEKATIESTFVEEGEKKTRRFDFVLKPDGITSHTVESTNEEHKVATKVLLEGVRDRYTGSFPAKQKTIALRIVEHCLEYFVLGRIPKIYLHDEYESKAINLESIYNELVSKSKLEEYEVDGKEFSIRHFLLDISSGCSHRVDFCANMRVVDGISLRSKIPDLKGALPDGNGEERLIYRGYVSGEYLDEYVNEARTGFYTAEDDDLFAGSVTLRSIERQSVSKSNQYLKEYIEPVRKKKRERIREYVNEKAPQFRHVLKHREGEVDEISPDASEDELDNELYQISKEIEVENRKRGKEILDGEQEKEETEEEIREKYDKFIDELNDIAKSNLAKYIVHRGRTLEVLEKRLSSYPDDDYALEDAIHRTIFPLQSTSDEVSYEDQNLWILDEKLSFHHYLASDTSFSGMDVVESDSRERPDLLIFNNPIAVTDDNQPSTGVTIFEFKRPMRDDYSDDNNPIDQVLRYVERIKDGDVKDRSGRSLNVNSNTPFQCFIVADLTSSLRRRAETSGFFETPDSEGFVGYVPARNAYVEIASFDKLLRDAKRRNSILFEKLDLSI